MNFQSIPGLTHIKSKLKTAVYQNHLAHALLFSGKPGSLNLPTALALSQYLHCSARGEDSCGLCAACLKNNKYIHPDTTFIFPYYSIKSEKGEEKVRSKKLKEWRSFLLENPFGGLTGWISYLHEEGKSLFISREDIQEMIRTLQLTPFESRYKIVIIWLPEQMLLSSTNAILKILEEPISHTYFFLVTQTPDQLLSTVTSRTQHVSVPLLSDDELDKHLDEIFQIKEDQRREIIQIAEGNITVAYSLVNEDQTYFFDYFFNWMLACYKNNYIGLVNLSAEFHTINRHKQNSILNYSLSMLREIVAQLIGANSLHRIQKDRMERVVRLSKFMSIEKIDVFYECINTAIYNIARNGNAKMIFLDMSLQLSKTFHR